MKKRPRKGKMDGRTSVRTGARTGARTGIVFAKSQKVKKSKLDEMWAKVIKKLAHYKCEYCGGTQNLNSHHIYSRNNLSVRWDVSNGLCLCVKHHMFDKFSAHSAPLEMLEFLKQKRGEEWYETLRTKAKQTVKLSDEDRRELYVKLREKFNNKAESRGEK